MKMLYISSFHGTLEYNELNIFNELGIDWFSTGLYIDPQNPIKHYTQSNGKKTNTITRATIDKIVDPYLLEQFKKLNPAHEMYKPTFLNKEFIDNFDIIFVSYCAPYPYFLNDNWDKIRNKIVIWRTFAQQAPRIEHNSQQFREDGLKIVRISPREKTILGYIGEDAIIREYVDENEYDNWNGRDKKVLTFNSDFGQRTLSSNTNIYMDIRNKMISTNFELYGCGNDDVSISLGLLSWKQQQEQYRNARVYFALGTKPSTTTYNFLEPLMTGCPIITWGPVYGNAINIPAWKNLYEVPDIIKNGVNGFSSDNTSEIESYIDLLMNDDKLANSISINARQTAIEMFSKKNTKKDWNNFFNTLF